jgi:hypothetical protein
LASAAPFLCLMVCHFEWPDMLELQEKHEEIGAGIVPHGHRRL